MGTTGFKSFETRPKRYLMWIGAVLALSLLAVSCTGGDEDEADDSRSVLEHRLRHV